MAIHFNDHIALVGICTKTTFLNHVKCLPRAMNIYYSYTCSYIFISFKVEELHAFSDS